MTKDENIFHLSEKSFHLFAHGQRNEVTIYEPYCISVLFRCNWHFIPKFYDSDGILDSESTDFETVIYCDLLMLSLRKNVNEYMRDSVEEKDKWNTKSRQAGGIFIKLKLQKYLKLTSYTRTHFFI